MNKNAYLMRQTVERLVGMLSQQRIAVTQRGMDAFVEYAPDGSIKRMGLPSIPDDASDQFLAALQGFIDHEVGHVLFSTPATLIKSTKAGPRIASMTNIVEDTYVERRITEMFSGSGSNLDSVRKFFLEDIARPAIKKALMAGDAKTALGWLITQQCRAWAGQATPADFCAEPEHAAVLKTFVQDIGDMAEDFHLLKCSDDSLHLATRIVNRIQEREREREEEAKRKASGEKGKGDDAAGEKSGLKSKGDGAAGKKSKGGKPSKEKAEEAKSPEEKPEGAKPEPKKEEPKKEEKPEPEPEGEPKPEPEPEGEGEGDGGASEPEPEGEGKGDGSDEEGDGDGASEAPSIGGGHGVGTLEALDTSLKDFDSELLKGIAGMARAEVESSEYAVYTREFDIIGKPSPYRADSAVANLESEVLSMVGVMAKQLERAVAAQSRVGFIPGMRKGRINPTGLYRAGVGDDRLFRQRYERKSRNVAISLLVDCSGSMGGPRITVAGKAAYALSMTLERLSVQHEVIGFTTQVNSTLKAATGKWSRGEALFMPLFKSFDGRLDSDAKARIAALTQHPSWLRENVDGECVLHAGMRLLTRQNVERRILIVLSDGYPSCPPGLGLNPHLRSAVETLEKSGVECIGIGIQTTSVERFYKRSLVLDAVHNLPGTCMRQLTQILLS